MTLTELFKEGASRGIIDWSLRVDCSRPMPRFYIHASLKSSATLDFAIDVDTFGKEFLVPSQSNEVMKWPDDLQK